MSRICEKKISVDNNQDCFLLIVKASRCCITLQVMAQTQSQFDEALKPVSLLLCASVENGANPISVPNLKSIKKQYFSKKHKPDKIIFLL